MLKKQTEDISLERKSNREAINKVNGGSEKSLIENFIFVH